MFSCEFYEISKNTFYCKTSLVAASGKSQKSFGFLTFSWGIEIEHEVKWVKFSEKLLLQTLCFISSHRSCSVKKCVLRNCAKFTGKHLCQSLIFNKELTTLFKKRYRCFHVNFAKFLRTHFLRNTSGPLLFSFLTHPHLVRFQMHTSYVIFKVCF